MEKLMLMLTGRRTRRSPRALRRQVARAFAGGTADADWAGVEEREHQLLLQGIVDGQLPDEALDVAG